MITNGAFRPHSTIHNLTSQRHCDMGPIVPFMDHESHLIVDPAILMCFATSHKSCLQDFRFHLGIAKSNWY